MGHDADYAGFGTAEPDAGLGRISDTVFLDDTLPLTGFMLIDTAIWGEQGDFIDALMHMILPAIVLGTIPLAVIVRMTRSSMLEVLGEDYIRTARAKGLTRMRVIVIHALRNAMLPVVTVIGLQVGTLLAGAILTETIFSWPGLGRWLIDALQRRDYPVVQGGVLLVATMVILVNLLVDLLYGVVNPRIRHKKGAIMSQVTENKVIAAPVPMTPLQEFWHYFKRNKGAVVGLVYVVVMIVIAVFANFLAPITRRISSCDSLLAPPFWQDGGSIAHLLGTDDVGRDILSRLMYGARLSLLVGCLVVVSVADPRRGARPGGGLFRRSGGLNHHARRRYYAGAAESAAGAGAGGNLRALHRQRLAGANLRGAPALCASHARRGAGGGQP